MFAPTLNVPAPLISLFVTDHATIFGAPIDEADSPIFANEITMPAPPPTDLRSPRKQMFSDLPTPGYNQTTFQSFGGPQYQDRGGLDSYDTGMIPLRPTYHQLAPQGDGAFGSLNDALAPSVPQSNGTTQVSKETKSKRRESGMLLMNMGLAGQRKSSMQKLRQDENNVGSF